MVSQNIIGKIYDSESTAKGIQIINITQNIKTFSNENGNFSIKASINDSLQFKSLFHEEKFIKVSENDYNYTLVIELKKSVNELGEVLLNDGNKTKTFDPIDYTQALTMGIAEDMKKNPYKYQPKASFGGANHFFLIQKLFSLFKKNKEKKETPVKMISFATFDSLFSNDIFFNEKLLQNHLQVNDTLKPLFFNYCDAQNLDSKLLHKQNQLILLDSLLQYSKRFQKIINESKKE